jgi:hypothetical protein
MFRRTPPRKCYSVTVISFRNNDRFHLPNFFICCVTKEELEVVIRKLQIGVSTSSKNGEVFFIK